MIIVGDPDSLSTIRLKPNMWFNYINRNDFIEYAELCYREFGDRVKHWITLNEPLTFTSLGYAYGSFPPARCSKWLPLSCAGGDSGTEPYVVAHHQILAHAAVVNVYRDKYQVLSCMLLIYDHELDHIQPEIISMMIFHLFIKLKGLIKLRSGDESMISIINVILNDRDHLKFST